ncbi:hypothetical protein KI387_034441, partial [Taxus chinensis]
VLAFSNSSEEQKMKMMTNQILNTGSGKFSIAKLITYGNVWRASRVQNVNFRSLNISISENHFQGKVTYASAGRGRGRMTFSRSETYVFLEPGKDEQFVTLDELKERLKEWLETWPEDLEMPVDLTKFNNNLEDAVAHLVKFACELEIGGGAGDQYIDEACTGDINLYCGFYTDEKNESLSSEIREHFSKDKILEAMGVMNPNFWNTEGGRANFVRKQFHKSMDTIMEHFAKTSEFKGMEIKERVFSALSFIKSKLRNKLDKNLESCMRCYVSRYSMETFPFDRAIAHWNSLCKRRGVNNTAISTTVPNVESGIGASSHSTEENIEFEEAIDNGLFQL